MSAARLALPIVFVALCLGSTEPAAADEPQWIWSTREAASKAAPGEVAFRKGFDVAGVESATVVITADNAFDLFVNGRHVGSGDNRNKRWKFDIKPLLVLGRNILAVRASNGGEDPAGLAAELAIKPAGKAATSIVTDGSWKWSTRFGGRWATAEFDDSNWENAFALGAYGKTGPWGGPGEIVQGAASPAAKERNRERGLFHFKDGDRLVLLGSAFIERMQSNGYFELELISAHPDKNITVRNLGWSGDNVWGDARAVFGSRADGFKRLVSDVHLCKPSVILVCYGENEAYAGDAGLDDFRDGFEKLLDALEATGARIVVATPRKHENVGKPFPDPTKYNADLRKYCDAMKEIAKEREHTFVDWFDVGADYHRPLTDNGMHLTPKGHIALALKAVESLGGVPVGASLDIDVRTSTYDAAYLLVNEFSGTADGFVLEGTPTRLPPAAYTPLQNIPTGGFIDFRVRSLNRGRYVLAINGRAVSDKEAKDWGESDFPVLIASDLRDRALELLAAIHEKNFLFFNRYRPQNETYLFLFRKHEQGNNAVEIPQFDPLIEEQEKIIAELKKPPKQKFELRRVGD
jgi:lysophospholipase L1-like esterase